MRRLAAGARVPEERLAARLAVLLAAAVTIIALAVTGGLLITSGVCLTAVAAGHWFSWRGRHRPRTAGGQALLGALIIACVAYLFIDLTTGFFGGSLPQARFAVFALAVTSFDLKSRRNLFTHVWHSAIILYVASVFAWNPYFLPFVLGWGGCLFAFLYLTRLERTRAPHPRLALWVAAWLGISGALFVGLPHFAGPPIAVPLLVSIPVSEQATPEVLPAVLPLAGGQPAGGEESINLRVRGRLGEEVVFRVRAAAPAYWRAYTLETYTGQSWSRVARPAEAIPPVSTNLAPADEGPVIGALPESFFIERPLSPDIPIAYPAKELYFPARGLLMVDTGTIRSPVALRRGLTYSGESAVRDISPSKLRQAGPVDTTLNAADLRLPRGTPARVTRLAAQLAAGRPSEYDRVAAIETYLRSHYRYSLDTPRLESGADAVDQFLFRDHVGFCEQFASALAVMLRSQGIPARLAVGYSTGDRDALTGTYTVRARDAHAWVEVLFPGTGWVPFDASPGFEATPGNGMPARWLLSDLNPQFVFTGLTGAPGGLPGIAAAVALVALVVVAVAVFVRRARGAGSSPALRSYRRALVWLRVFRLPSRAPGQTPAEHLASLGVLANTVAGALEPVVADLEAAVFAGLPVRRRSALPVALAALRWRLPGREDPGPGMP